MKHTVDIQSQQHAEYELFLESTPTCSALAPPTQVKSLKSEVSFMLQDIVVAEAAIVSLKMAVDNPAGEDNPASVSLTTPKQASKEASPAVVTSLVQLLSGESPSGGPNSGNGDEWDDSFNVEEMEAVSKDESAEGSAVPSG